MLDSIFQSILNIEAAGTAFPWQSFLLCTGVSLLLGIIIACFYMYRNAYSYSKSFVATLATLPAIVQLVIMLVNGNLGAGLAVMGAFSLVRFRSIPGSAKEISSIFLAMAIGLATGMGFLGIAVMFTLILGLTNLLLDWVGFGEQKNAEKTLRITIPEGLDYSGVFDDLFERYLSKWDLVQVKTTNMGSLFKLDYRILLKDMNKERELINELRCRNGNLEILCGRVSVRKEEL
ncbi:uncharacterized protein DUF4956 [Desulfitobacterium sp. LBE]|uniref:DUF4956 domain-containing protein n=5 Tax=root TaxID=1 RepID=Q24Y86_DESHY|nr:MULTISPECIES: DUF4956 domain-containing protein [Desulfitobacterium]ACL20337.1 conserved hypothetical protein [Desulfitobacterium hafniense DCB-2]EHL05668.1 hypothetical protein HMPREF0322_03688 [Desulfitobacterium hafniense DP7]KTE90540.1 cell division protein FtsZ [Desulfitobacterium hafniense]MEA5021651.1 DUF4956 domain-containing protein [Desulfitobacterium hafniense]TWH56807.1 uncharacterized protein DUF4956 [Desulfitobacterium sp. LBE]